MSVVIAQSFMKQLRRLTEREQGMVSNTILGLQYDSTSPKFNIHQVEGNAGWWTCYVNGDWRIILARQGESMVLCWTDHHDDAYLWAKRHVLERHPVTGGMQLGGLIVAIVLLLAILYLLFRPYKEATRLSDAVTAKA